MPERQARTTGACATPGTALESGSVVQASALLGKRQSVEIEFNGQRYRLQTTKAGKLILTK
jgi:hemin uptake protein HemP